MLLITLSALTTNRSSLQWVVAQYLDTALDQSVLGYKRLSVELNLDRLFEERCNCTRGLVRHSCYQYRQGDAFVQEWLLMEELPRVIQ